MCGMPAILLTLFLKLGLSASSSARHGTPAQSHKLTCHAPLVWHAQPTTLDGSSLVVSVT